MKIPPFHWWRTVFWLIPTISVYTVVLGSLSIGSSLVQRSGTFAHACARAWAWLILATTRVQVHVTGLERLTRGMAYVFVSNHQSIYDIPIIFASLPFQLRIVAKASLGNVPFLGWHLRRTGHLLVERIRPGVAVLTDIGRLIQQGASPVVFPEGTRSLDGRLAPFKRGIFLVAIEAGLAVVPVSVVGSRHVMRKGRLMTCPAEVDLVMHDPISTAFLTRADAAALAERVRQVIESAVRDPAQPATTRDPAQPATI